MKITIITDDLQSWFIPYGNKLLKLFSEIGHDAEYVHDKDSIREGDICFILSCTKIIGIDYLKLNRHNIVVHASDLPSGKGFSPLQWQILEGKNEIIVSLLEADLEADSGPVYLKSKLNFDGTELYEELRQKLGDKIIRMCMKYLENYDSISAETQTGEESFYPRRKLQDDELDISKTIVESFNHFRIADNERHPLYFRYLGKKYILKIFTEKD